MLAPIIYNNYFNLKNDNSLIIKNFNGYLLLTLTLDKFKRKIIFFIPLNERTPLENQNIKKVDEYN